MKPELLLEKLALLPKCLPASEYRDCCQEVVDEAIRQLTTARSAGVRGVVVIPDHPDNDTLASMGRTFPDTWIKPLLAGFRSGVAWARQHARIEPAPLQDGEVVVSVAELDALRSLYSWMSTGNDHFKISFKMSEFPQGAVCLEAIASAMDALDALRSRPSPTPTTSPSSRRSACW
jgi:hypothetical protein